MCKGVTLVVVTVVLASACSRSSQPEAGPATTATDAASTLTGVSACWQTVADEYQDASDQAILILRDGVADLLGAHRSFSRALDAGDTGRTRRALGGFIDAAQSVTEASADFDRARRQAAADESHCDDEGSQGTDTVSVCWKDVAEAYRMSASQADRALDKPVARILFGLQQAIAEGNQGDVAGVHRANRTLTKGLNDVIPLAGRFARLAGAATAERDECVGS
jgi:cytochrome c551/c552